MGGIFTMMPGLAFTAASCRCRDLDDSDSSWRLAFTAASCHFTDLLGIGVPARDMARAQSTRK